MVTVDRTAPSAGYEFMKWSAAGQRIATPGAPLTQTAQIYDATRFDDRIYTLVGPEVFGQNGRVIRTWD